MLCECLFVCVSRTKKKGSRTPHHTIIIRICVHTQNKKKGHAPAQVEEMEPASPFYQAFLRTHAPLVAGASGGGVWVCA